MTQQTDSSTPTVDDARQKAIARGTSLNLDRVLVPLNGYRRSEQILPFASMLADWFSGEITLFHSLPATHPARGARPGQVHYPDAPHDRGTALAQAYLEEVVSRLGPHGIKSRWGIATGDAATMITSRSATSSFGVVAVATTARTRPHRFLSPGLLDNLWRTTSVPLLIVNPLHGSLNGTEPRPPRTLIVPCMRGVDDSALAFSSAIAGASRSNVKLVMADSNPAGQSESDLLKPFLDDGVETEIISGEKRFVDQVLKLQEDNAGSWTIVGSRMRSGIRRSILGCVADMLARQAVGPIMVVPDPKVMRQRKRIAQETTRSLASSA